MSTIIPVVAGILYNTHGEILLSSRPIGKAYAGYWEFAGGKVEPNETELTALKREFQEELGIHIHYATPYITQTHHYEHASVRLRFFRIRPQDWSGTPQPREQQQYCWQHPKHYTVSPMLPANAALLHTLSLPQQLSGSLTQGLNSPNNHYPLLPHPHQQPNAATLFTAQQINNLNKLPQTDNWLLIQQPNDIQLANQVQAAIWHIQTPNDAQALINILQQGSPIPISVYTTPALQQTYQSIWHELGIHTIITPLSNTNE